MCEISQDSHKVSRTDIFGLAWSFVVKTRAKMGVRIAFYAPLLSLVVATLSH